MQRIYFIVGLLCTGFGLWISSGATIRYFFSPYEFFSTINLAGLGVVGLVLAIGIFFWLKSGSLRSGKVAWFFAGAAISWMAWTISNAVVYRAKDYTKQWPTHDREIAPEWMSNAKGRRLGNYRWLAPADSSNASALIELYGPKFNGLPGFLIEDENGDGSVDSILISDSAHRTFEFDDKNGDGVFDTYEYTTGFDPDSKSYRDDNMDGQYDFRLGPGRVMAVFIDSQWRDVVFKDGKSFVELEGKVTPVEVFPAVKLMTKE